VACGADDPAAPEHHHLIPRSLGGSDDETNLITLCGVCHGNAHDIVRPKSMSALTRVALAAAKARGVKLGGTNAQSIANRDEANQREALRPIFSELADLSANAAAAELNRRSVATPQGGQWHALTVIRLRQRLP
jgi:hypothetical protein